MIDDTPQILYVRVDTAFFAFSGMSKDTVLGLLPGFGAGAEFTDKQTYDAAIAAQTEASAAMGR